MRTALHGLVERGQSPWMDQLSRELLRGGDLAALVDSGVLGVTSNPTIFQDAMSSGDAYDAQKRDLTGQEPKEIFLALAADDIRDACDLLAGKGTSPQDGKGLERQGRSPSDKRCASTTRSPLAAPHPS